MAGTRSRSRSLGRHGPAEESLAACGDGMAVAIRRPAIVFAQLTSQRGRGGCSACRALWESARAGNGRDGQAVIMLGANGCCCSSGAARRDCGRRRVVAWRGSSGRDAVPPPRCSGIIGGSGRCNRGCRPSLRAIGFNGVELAEYRANRESAERDDELGTQGRKPAKHQIKPVSLRPLRALRSTCLRW